MLISNRIMSENLRKNGKHVNMCIFMEIATNTHTRAHTHTNTHTHTHNTLTHKHSYTNTHTHKHLKPTLNLATWHYVTSAQGRDLWQYSTLSTSRGRRNTLLLHKGTLNVEISNMTTPTGIRTPIIAGRNRQTNHYTTSHYTTLYTILHYTILYYTILHYTKLHYTLHYTTLLFL